MSAKKTTILLVDDEKMLLDITQRMLELAGYAVLGATSALAALAISRTHDSTINLLVSDIHMPEMNGIELAEHLKCERPGIHVLYISGYVEEHDPGIKHTVLAKPFMMSDLLRKVSEILKSNS